jgi:hypothetical protein
MAVFELASELSDGDASSSWVWTVEAEDSRSVPCDALMDSECVEWLWEWRVAGADCRCSAGRSCDVETGGEFVDLVRGDETGRWRGSRSLVSSMLRIRLCISLEVICFSCRSSHELAHLSSGGLFGGPQSSSEMESQLVDSWGMESSAAVASSSKEMFSRAFLQQKVSLFHSLQLRFSNRLPLSIACEVLEKSDHWMLSANVY